MTKPKTLILTDDDEDDRDFFISALQSISYEASVRTFNDGAYLIEYLEGGCEKPDIIFLDINMPRLNGLEALERVRTMYTKEEVPVVMYTTSSNEMDKMQAENLGANLYVEKPSDYNRLKTVIAEVVNINWNEYNKTGKFCFNRR